jgi:N-acetyl-gamma-glutamyl-phosphate reductase
MTVELFIDGAWGTTGLEIRERLASRKDIRRLELSESERKDPRARARALNDAGIVVLCLPDDAAREAVAMIENPAVRVIDASTAHRVAKDWTFGFPELEPGQFQRIAQSKRVSNPGCYSTAFLALVRPLVRSGILTADWPVSVSGISGYSGGGRPMIEEFENTSSPNFVQTVARNYALSLVHKHVPEMKVHSGLAHAPIFSPTVARYYRGMLVEVPLALWALPGRPTSADIRDALGDAYRGSVFIDVASAEESGALKTLDAESLKNSNKMKLYVFANETDAQARLVAVLDNLGKGASGAAVQNLNIMMGIPETTGLL